MKYPPAFPAYPVETIRDLVFAVSDRYSDRDALMSKVDGAYRPLDYPDLRLQVEETGTALLTSGLRKGDKVAILGNNRTEWALSYLGCVSSGLVAVPIDKDLTEREILHIIEFSEAKALIAGADYLSALSLELPKVATLEIVVCLDPDCAHADYSFRDFLGLGREALEEKNPAFADATVAPDDLAVLIFTSGTTGASKGVMLSHGNIISNVIGTSYHVAINEHDVLLSVLPLHHTYEATAGFLTALYQGATICYAESLRRIGDNLRETRATVMLGVPALFESMYRRIRAGIQEKGSKKFLVGKGVAALSEKIFRINLRRRLFGKIHEKVGGQLRLLISGGAAINPEVSRGFRELGVDFIQGYGMTEYSPIIAVNRVMHFKDASVGIPLPGAEVQIVDDEIVVKGPCVMQGYYRNPEATDEVLRDGWLYTGDLGYFDREGFLFVSGRRKSVIVTPNGKNVYPEEIEAILNRSPYILESLVWGGAEADPSLTEVQAIIVPNTEHFDHEFGAADYDEEAMMQRISQDVRECNKQLPGFKRVKKFVLRGEEFEKTTTRKIKRYLYTGKTKPLKKR